MQDDPLYPNGPIRAQITALELSALRAIREALLGDPTAVARVKAINDQIIALRGQLT